MKTKRKTTSKKRGTRKKENVILSNTIGAVLVFLSVFSYVALLFPKSGLIGKFVKHLLLGLFSYGAFIIPILLLLYSITFLGKKQKFIITKKFGAILLLLLDVLCALFIKDRIYFVYDDFQIVKFISSSFKMGRQLKGGGVFGNFIGNLAIGLLGLFGAIILVIFTFGIAYMLYMNISPAELWALVQGKAQKEKKLKLERKRERMETNLIPLPIKPIEEQMEPFEDKKDWKEVYDEEKEIQSVSPIIHITPSQAAEDPASQEPLTFITKEETEKQEKIPFVSTETPVISLYKENEQKKKKYKLPTLDLLTSVTKKSDRGSSREAMDNASVLNQMLKSFHVGATVSNITIGPAVTRYELQLNPGVKVSKIVGLSDDIALALASSGIRIEAPIPGKSAVGIEVPNKSIATISIREILSSSEFKNAKSKLTFGIGKDIAGNTIVADLAKMPHLLIAGATGSGKSVCINTLIASILYKATPEEVKLIMVDPKVVELSVYNQIPHLMIPVVTDPKKAASALNWAVMEMTERYKKFADSGVRDISGYNGREDIVEKMSQIVIIIDELADLMMASPGEIEDYICRLAQMARAAGMHLVIATQRPSVDVITGLIKANIPSRISFAVSSTTDSRTILDMGGAEKLLGKGDMLYYPVGQTKPKRIQGAFMSDQEVEQVVQFIKDQSSAEYSPDIMEKIEAPTSADDSTADVLLPEAIKIVVQAEQASASLLQRRLKIGYNRAACLIEELEKRRIIGEYEGSKPRKVLISQQELDAFNADD